MQQFKLPDLGEGLQDAEIVEWKVAEGQVVEVDELLVVVETAKAVVELPSPIQGKVARLCAKPGDTVHVGETLVEYEGQGRESVSVVGELKTSHQATTDPVVEETFKIGSTLAPEPVSVPQQSSVNTGRNANPFAAPPEVVAFAKQLGLEAELTGQNYGRMTKSVLAQIYEEAQKRNNSESETEEGNADSGRAPATNRVLRLSAAKRVMAQAMTQSHQHIPAVTLVDDALIDEWPANEDITLRLLHALIAACQEVPMLNAWFDEENLSIQTFSDINIGVAVNTKDGLFVPVLHQSQTLTTEQIRGQLDEMIEAVTRRTIKPQKLLGATISLSNFGTLSGRYATPMIVPPQVAILGVGKIRQQAIVKNNALAIGKIVPLSLSFDHRVATGGDAATFLNTVIAQLQKPTALH